MLHFYDFEVFKYDWLVVIINPVNRTKTVIINDKKKLEKYYDDFKNDIWIGYNSRNYDQYILKGILCDFDPKEINDYIIEKGKKGWQYSSLFRKYKLNNYDVSTKFYGLKQLEAFMGNDIEETSVPFDIDRKLTEEEIQETVHYCTHDVEQTIEVFLQRKVEFDAQMALIKLFDLPLDCITKTQAQLAAIILKANRRQEFDDEWDIRMPDTLKLDKYRYIADWFLNHENHDSKKSLTTNVAGIPHIFAWGGLHGAVKQYAYECKNDEVLIMADVSQLYPFLMLTYRLLSRNVPDEAYEILEYTVKQSLVLKALKKKKEREPFKRFNNIIYGSEGDGTNPMYDPLHRNLVCVFGQILILDLIEKIESFSELIQSNTDGILIKIKKKDFDKLDEVVYEWEQRTGLTMEFDMYKKVIQKDVNNYIVVDYDDHYKSKGAYIKSLNPIDNDLPIVNRAITQYLIDKTPIEKTINECNNLIDFQKIVKVSSKYAFAMHNGEILKDKTFRVFASKKSNDTYIGKCKSIGSTCEKFGNTPEHCFIDNSDITKKIVPEKLNREWYINLAKQRLDQFGVDLR